MNDNFLDSFKDWMRAGGRSPSTIKLRLSHLRALEQRVGALDDVTTDELVHYLSSHDWSPSTLRSHRASLRLFYAWMRRAGHVKVDPSEGVPSVILPRSLPRPAGEQTIAAALVGATPRVQTMIELMAYAGLRRSEVARVHSRHLTTVDGYHALRVKGKGGNVRVVPIPGHLARTIAAAPSWLFPGDDDGHLSPAYVGKLVSRALPEGITGHMLRHRYATEGYRRGHDIRAVQELLGHAKLDTTMVYTLVSTEQLSEVAGRTWKLAA